MKVEQYTIGDINIYEYNFKFNEGNYSVAISDGVITDVRCINHGICTYVQEPLRSQVVKFFKKELNDKYNVKVI